MDFFDTAAAVLIGNLLAAWFLFGVHTFKESRLLGAAFMAVSSALTFAFNDAFGVVSAAAFVASIFAVSFLWGMWVLARHEDHLHLAPVGAWIAAIAPVAVAIVWLWQYAPIG